MDDINRLLAKAGRGDGAALESLYRQLGNGVYCLALSILGEKGAAEDVLQETFVRVWTMAHTHSPGKSGRSWILAIARNLCLDRLRAAQNAGPSQEGEEERSGSEALSFVDNLELKDALGKLEEQARKIVVLHLAAGFKFREIAALLGEKQSRVQRAYYAGVEQLSAYYTIQ